MKHIQVSGKGSYRHIAWSCSNYRFECEKPPVVVITASRRSLWIPTIARIAASTPGSGCVMRISHPAAATQPGLTIAAAALRPLRGPYDHRTYVYYVRPFSLVSFMLPNVRRSPPPAPSLIARRVAAPRFCPTRSPTALARGGYSPLSRDQTYFIDIRYNCILVVLRCIKTNYHT